MASNPSAARHATERVRHELKMRELEVRRVRELTPQMRRITLGGESLAGFVSAAPDDHVKIFLPEAAGGRPILPMSPPSHAASAGPRPIARDYTPRRFDAHSGELDLDFVLHGDGPAAQWAAAALPGHHLGVGGPRGSFVVADDFDWYLLLGDETALPAIGRRLEELRAEARIHAIIEVADAGEQQPLRSRAEFELSWLHRGHELPGDPARLLAAARALKLPPGEGYIWIAAETQVARALRTHFIDALGHPKEWIKAAGYWKHGAIATHETHND